MLTSKPLPTTNYQPPTTNHQPPTTNHKNPMLAALVVYVGFVVAGVGSVSVLRPLRFIGVPTRKAGAILAVTGLLVAIIGSSLPARDRRVERPSTHLDEFAPVWQFSEFHTIWIDAPPERVFEAIQKVRADEILLFRTLTWIRRFGRPAPETILDPSGSASIIDVATRGGFLRLAEEPPFELVIGTILRAPREFRGSSVTVTPEIYRSISRPGFTLATMNFLVRPDPQGGSRVSTETRVFATSASGRRRFARYWRVIYPGSAIIRRMWLRAIKRRAEL